METYLQWGQHLTRAETYEAAAELFDRIDGSWEARTAAAAIFAQDMLGGRLQARDIIYLDGRGPHTHYTLRLPDGGIFDPFHWKLRSPVRLGPPREVSRADVRHAAGEAYLELIRELSEEAEELTA